MAEAVAFSLASKILSAVASPALKKAYEKGNSIWEATDDLAKLQVRVETIQAVLLDAERKQDSSDAVKNWIKRLKSVLYDAEDLFDEFATEDLIKQQMMEGKSKLSLKAKVRVYCSKLNPVVSKNSIAKKVKDIGERLAEISTDMAQFQFVRCLDEKPVYNMGRGEDRGCFVDAKSVIGRDEDKKVMLEMLFNESNSAESDNPVVLAIVGIGGMGKTTLAQLIFNDKKIKNTFEKRWFACISDISDERDFFGKIFQSIRGVSYSDLTVTELQTKIRESIASQKYLLVLDDVWEKNHARWQNRMSLLNGCASESRIIVTTRSPLVAEVVGALRPHNLKGLSEYDAWSLFKKSAFREGYENDARRESLGKQILKKCSGVPLAIRSIGSLLYEENTIGEWEAIEKLDLSVLGRKHKDETMGVLKLSYDHLPSNLKQCFAYCCLFPKDYRYNKRELIYHWISQGYINFDDEETGFMHLFRMGFFQEDKYFGISSCKIHDIMHDLALYVIGEEGEFGTSSSVSRFTRHVSLIVDGGEGGSWNIPPSLHNVKSIRSCMLRMLSSNKDIQPALNQLCSNFKWLRTLTLSNLGIEHIPPSIGELKLVKYLDVSYNKFIELPDSITSLVNLLALNLKGCRSLEVLPRNFKNLIKLRFLELTATISSMPEGVAGIHNLRYLSHFVVRNWSEVDGLNKLLERVRGELFIKFDTEKEVEHEEKWQLPAIISLQDIRISCYTGHGIGGWRNSVSEIRLEYLEIENCKNVKHIPPVSRLPVLKFLRLRELPELEFIEEEEEVDTHNPATMHKFFPCLEKLELLNLPKLKGWHGKVASEATSTSSKSGFPGKALASLKYLHIERCSSLTSLHLPSACLDQIIVEKCDELKSIELNQSQDLGLLSISNCDKLKSIELNQSQYLGFLSISKCDELKSIELNQSQSIRSLDIKYCRQLESLHIEALALAEMEEIEIFGCPDLKLLNTQDKSLSMLRSVDSVLLERSPSLLLTSSLKMIHISECKWEISLRCLELTSLETCNLSYIYGLQSLHIPSPHLEEIELDSCVGLTSVEVEAPTEITISGCSELKNFRIAHPVALRKLSFDAEPSVDWGSIPNLAGCSRLARICIWSVDVGFVERLLSSPPSSASSSSSSCPSEKEMSIFKSTGSLTVALESLQSFSIFDVPGLKSLIIESPNLEKLDISYCNELTSVELFCCFELKNVHLEEIALDSLKIDECPELSLNTCVNWDALTNLELKDLPKLKGWHEKVASEATSTSSESGFPGKALASLEYLRIEGCSSLTSLCLTSPRLRKIVVENCNELKSIELDQSQSICFLKISGCTQVESLHIEALVLAGMEEIEIYGALFLELCNLPKLKGWHGKVASEATSTLSKSGLPGEALASLEYLRIDGCSSLTSLCLASPRLREIVVENCDELKSIELDQSQSIRSLNIRDCTQLESLHIEVPVLAGMEEIEIYGALVLELCNLPKLKGWHGKVASEATSTSSKSGFPGEALASLEYLCIERCSSLTSLHLASPRLQEIVVENCDELKSIELDQSQSIRSLNIKYCRQLESLHIEALTLAGMKEIRIYGCRDLKLLNTQDKSLSVLRSVDSVLLEHSPSLLLTSSLKKIKISDCKWEISLRCLELTSLETCFLKNIYGLQSLHIPSPHLKDISLYDCVGLTSVEVEAPAKITISGCSELKNFRIAHPVALRKLRIHAEHSVDWGSISNLAGCSRLARICIGSVDVGFVERLLSSPPSSASSSSCPSEKEMSIFKSTGSLTVALASLTKFSIYDVPGLKSLIIESLNLEEIYISCCDELTSVELFCCFELKSVELTSVALASLRIVQCPELSLNTGVDWDALTDLRYLRLYPLPPPEELPQCLLQRRDDGRLRITESYNLWDYYTDS